MVCRHKLTYTTNRILAGVPMARTRKAASTDRKAEALRRRGTLNPRPDRVADSLFVDSDFFDARDLVQVKYEMVRRVRAEGRPISHSAAEFGLSRPTFYQAQAALRWAAWPRWCPRNPDRGEPTSSTPRSWTSSRGCARRILRYGRWIWQRACGTASDARFTRAASSERSVDGKKNGRDPRRRYSRAPRKPHPPCSC